MIVYRLSKKEYARDLSGRGAELYGGRWNSKGRSMLYTSQSKALAFVELAIHIPVGIVPKDYFLVSILIPDTATILPLRHKDLPKDWRSNPHGDSTQQIGDKFLRASDHMILQAPSAIVPGDFNFLINPKHPQAGSLIIQSLELFEFDSRFVPREK